MTIPVGIVGCGTMAAIHANAYRAVGARLVGIAGGNRERGTALARAHGIRWFADLGEMLDSCRPAAVSVTVPNACHYMVSLQALERGIAVLCEKTQAATEQESRALLHDVRRLGGRFQIGYMKRFHPVVRRFAEWVGELAELGGIDSGHLSCHQAMVRWPGDLHLFPPEQGGGILKHGGSHTLDLLLWVLGAAPTHVTAVTSTLDEAQVERRASGLLEFGSGAHVTMELSWSPLTQSGPFGTGWDETIMLRSVAGIAALTLVNWRHSATLRPRASIHRRATGRTEQFETAPFDWFLAEIRAFLCAVEDGTPCVPDAADGYLTDLTIHTCYRSAAEGRRVPVPW